MPDNEKLKSFLSENYHLLKYPATYVKEVINSYRDKLENKEPIGYGGIAKRLGLDVMKQVYSIMESLAEQDKAFSYAHEALKTSGLDFSDELVQSQIDYLVSRSIISEELGNLLKSLGIQYVERLPEEVKNASLEEIEQLKAVVSNEVANAPWNKILLNMIIERDNVHFNVNIIDNQNRAQFSQNKITDDIRKEVDELAARLRAWADED